MRKRYFKVLLMMMLVIALMASSAYAAGTIFYTGAGAGAAGNVPGDVALEAMGNARDFRLAGDATNGSGANNAGLRTSTTTLLISGDTLRVSFTNAGFDGSAVAICKSTGDTMTNSPISFDTPTANATSHDFRIAANVAANDSMFVTNSGDGTNCNASNKSLLIRIQPVSSASMATVSFSGFNSAGGGLAGANAPAVNIANIQKQFTTGYASNNTIIDYTASATSNGSHFLSGSTSTNAATAGNANIANGTNFAITATGSGLTVSSLISLQDTASWQGVQRVFMANSTACTLSANNAVNNAPSGTVNLSLPTGAFNGTNPAAYTGFVCADVTGTVALQSRTIKAAYDISVSSGGVDPAADSPTAVMVWNTNGYQGVLPYATTYSGYPTYCLINNTSSSSASITVDIMTSESGATLSSLAGLSLGSVGALGQKLIAFSGTSITPYTYSSGIETAGTAVTLTGLNSTLDRYAARISVGTTPANVTVKCYQPTPAGSYTDIPIFTSGTDTSYLKY